MAVAQHPGDFPSAARVAPQDGEIGKAFALACIRLAETMRALFDGSEILDGKNGKTAGNQLARELSASIPACVGEHVRTVPGDSAGVVIKLDVLGKIARCAGAGGSAARAFSDMDNTANKKMRERVMQVSDSLERTLTSAGNSAPRSGTA